MNCKEIEIYLYDYAEGKMLTENMFLIKEHLDTCMNCREKAEYLKKVNLQLEAEKQIKPSAALTDRINGAINRLPETKIVSFNKHKIIVRVAAAVIVAIGLLSGVMVGNKTYYVDNSDQLSLNEQFGLSDDTQTLEDMFIYSQEVE